MAREEAHEKFRSVGTVRKKGLGKGRGEEALSISSHSECFVLLYSAVNPYFPGPIYPRYVSKQIFREALRPPSRNTYGEIAFLSTTSAYVQSAGGYRASYRGHRLSYRDQRSRTWTRTVSRGGSIETSRFSLSLLCAILVLFFDNEIDFVFLAIRSLYSVLVANLGKPFLLYSFDRSWSSSVIEINSFYNFVPRVLPFSRASSTSKDTLFNLTSSTLHFQ